MKKIVTWTIAILITISAAIYQKTTGPTYPLAIKTSLNNKPIKFKLTRSATIEKGCKITVPIFSNITNANLVYRKYPGNYKFDTIKMKLDSVSFYASLPIQPAAGKLEYYICLLNKNNELVNTKLTPAIIRFKGDVPALYLIPHILFMFLAMLLSTLTALQIIFKTGKYKRTATYTIIFLFLGGLIFGPIVQLYAFNDAWTGWPFGYDLTDNKTLIAFIIWIVAYLLYIFKNKKWAIIVASIVLLSIYTIPHSAFGSEYNYKTGQIKTGE